MGAWSCDYLELQSVRIIENKIKKKTQNLWFILAQFLKRLSCCLSESSSLELLILRFKNDKSVTSWTDNYLKAQFYFKS